VNSRPRIVLIGPPASGKTKIGRELAKKLSEEFVDTDAKIAAQWGPIPEIFATRGEDWFREKEAEMVRDSLVESGVLSLGGGAIITESTREALAGHPVALLMISEEAVSHRVTDSAKRPLLTDGIESWKKLVQARMRWYRECAEVEIDVSHRAPEDVASELVSWLEARENHG
jgi:shikimate kinase